MYVEKSSRAWPRHQNTENTKQSVFIFVYAQLLAILKPENVLDGWLEIHSLAPDNSKLSGFLVHFVERWLKNEELSVQVWNCYKRLHRTTNATERRNNQIILEYRTPTSKMCCIVKREKWRIPHSYVRAQLNFYAQNRKPPTKSWMEGLKTSEKYQ